jgi:molybdenum cofactor cytidylyltransferase
MPDITAAHLDALIDAFDPAAGAAICVPVRDGRRGNPVLWARRFFDEIGALEGDVGAKSLIGLHAGLVREVPVADDAVLTDLDSPADFAARETTG